MKVVTFGELLLRLAAPGYTKLFQKDSLEATFCGGEANVAVSLSIFGIDSMFVTKLPNSDIGHAAAHSLDYFKVDTSEISYGEGRMGLYYLEKGAAQRPSRVIYDRVGSAISLASKEEFDWDGIFESSNWFHWTGINPALSDNLADVCLDACKKAKEKGLIVSCDLNYRSKLWTPEKAQRYMKPLMKYVDVCICNEEDSEKALGIESYQSNVDCGCLSETDYINNAKMIHSIYGCKYVATTLRKSYSASLNGWRAMLYDSNTSQSYFSKEYDIQIVDRVGGGDSFAAGLIYALVSGFNCQETIEFATAASCLKQTIEGDYNRTTIEDVNKLLESGGNGRVQR
ncbi:sugar kinase [Ruminococcus sp. FC2018]|uniref:sugar kinase n=1 Tax=Ruminococcus sp. FC2018 TaxID=1410617 RepID=UPI00048D781C|nr:sugar kinase [Ruminococcus sp. FC2018]